jgi:hypothetical protein
MVKLRRDDRCSRLVEIAKTVLPATLVPKQSGAWVNIYDIDNHGQIGIGIFPFHGGEIRVHAKEYMEIAQNLKKTYEGANSMKNPIMIEMYKYRRQFQSK